MSEISDREKDFRTLCTLALINSKHAHYLWSLKRLVKEDLLREGVQRADADSIDAVVLESLDRIGARAKIRDFASELSTLPNWAFMADSVAPQLALDRPPPPPVHYDSLDFVERAKLRWEKRIRQELNAMAAELGLPLSRSRRSTGGSDNSTRFVYDDNDFYDVLAAIANPNHAAASTGCVSWGVIKVELSYLPFDRLRAVFTEFNGSVRHVVSEELSGNFGAQFIDSRIAAYEEALGGSGSGAAGGASASELRAMARTGVPIGIRPRVWRRLLYTDGDDPLEQQQIQQLLEDVEAVELVCDGLFRLDASMVSNDHNYFVFEDLLHDVMLVFSRDEWVEMNAAASSQKQFALSTQMGQKIGGIFPPCGVVPFRGLVLYVTPLCFLFDALEDLYACFRRMYARYLSRLHTVSSDAGCIIQVCRQFEVLVQSQAPSVFMHMLRFGVQPLKIAFPWLMFGFSGTLDVCEVLQLWDRVIAYDSLLPIPVLAAAVFVFRSKAILDSSSQDMINEVFEDLTRIRVVPLMQWFLFRDSAQPSM